MFDCKESKFYISIKDLWGDNKNIYSKGTRIIEMILNMYIYIIKYVNKYMI